MKIAFLNRGRETHPGGDFIQIDATIAALRKRGIEADDVGWHVEKLKTYDLCHIVHCEFDWSWGNYEAVQKAGKKYVLTPMYYPGLRAGVTDEQVHTIISSAAAVLPFSKNEAGHCRIHVAGFRTPLEQLFPTVPVRPCSLSDLGMLPIVVIPNGTAREFFEDRWDKIPQPRILTVSARGRSDKNIAMVERIAKRIGVAFHCATGVPHHQLPALYSGYGVFVNASDSERMSLTIGEALCAGCRVLATKENWGNEHYPGLVTFDPKDELRLELLIRWALYSTHWDYRPNEMARCLTWDWVAEKLEEVYREVLGAA